MRAPLAVISPLRPIDAADIAVATFRLCALTFPPTVSVPIVEKLPLDVVVAFPPTQRLEDIETFVVEAPTRVVRPVTPSVPPTVALFETMSAEVEAVLVTAKFVVVA